MGPSALQLAAAGAGIPELLLSVVTAPASTGVRWAQPGHTLAPNTGPVTAEVELHLQE